MIRVQQVSSERRHFLDDLFQFDFECVVFERIRHWNFQPGILDQTQQADRFRGFVFEYVPQEFFFHIGRHRLQCRRASTDFFQFSAEFCDTFFLAGLVSKFNE